MGHGGVKSLWASVEGDPTFMRKLNGWLALGWLGVSPLIIYFLANSVPFLVFISIYAIVTGHWSAWQAARVEVRQEQDANVQDVIDKLDKQ